MTEGSQPPFPPESRQPGGAAGRGARGERPVDPNAAATQAAWSQAPRDQQGRPSNVSSQGAYGQPPGGQAAPGAGQPQSGQYAQGQYAQSQYGQGQYGQGQYAQGQYAQPQAPYGQYPYNPQAYGYGGYYPYYYDPGPGNGAAVASLTLATISFVLLFFSGGIAAPLSLILAIIAIPYGVKGKKAVDQGRTRRHRDVALAGLWTGIAAVIISIVAGVLWALFFVFLADSGGEADPGDLAALVDRIADMLSIFIAAAR